MNWNRIFGTLRLMVFLANFLNRKKVVVMFVSGGVGEFLFQLDLAKRLELEGFRVVLFIKKKYTFFAQIVQISTLTKTKLYNMESGRLVGVIYFFLVCLRNSVIVVNSFNSLYFGLITKSLYGLTLLSGGRVLVFKKDSKEVLFLETILYQEEEVIWKRNNRIVSYLINKEKKDSFPLIFTDTKRAVSVPYIHIHPVGSSREKSYPVSKLIKLFSLSNNINWIFTLTPAEAGWYLTEELKEYLEKNKHVTLIIKYFHASEIISLMTAAKCFCTVNTGLLWLACMNNIKTVVIDTFTDFEWNPSSYKNLIRLSHDFDEQGESLHLVKKNHEDGLYFESMYLVKPEEVNNALNSFLESIN